MVEQDGNKCVVFGDTDDISSSSLTHFEDNYANEDEDSDNERTKYFWIWTSISLCVGIVTVLILYFIPYILHFYSTI